MLYIYLSVTVTLKSQGKPNKNVNLESKNSVLFKRLMIWASFAL